MAKSIATQKQKVTRVDPVCGRTVMGEETSVSGEYKRRRYYFCSEACRIAFQHHTEQLRAQELARAGALFSPSGVRWGRA